MSLFVDLAELAEKLAGEGSKLKKRATIAEAIRRVAEESAAEAGRFCLYLAGLPFAEADVRKLNAGGAILSRAVKEVSGAGDAALTAAYRRHGDLGAAAFDLLEGRDQKTEIGDRNSERRGLRLEDVAEAFEVMARARTTAVRLAAVEGLLRRATALEAKYLLKLMLGDMRIGVKQSLVEEAIAVAAGVEVAAVRHGVMLEADLCGAVERAFAGTLAEARMRLFHPLGFMLASPVETPEEAVERFTAKPKKVEKASAVARGKKRKRGTGGGGADNPTHDDDETPPQRASSPGTQAVVMHGPPSVLAVDSAEVGFAEDVEAEARRNTGVSPLRETMKPSRSGRDDSTSGEAAQGDEQTGNEMIHAFLEDKFDGIRAQVHCGDPEQPGRVAIYSRNREDVTVSFPELEEAFSAIGEASGGLIFDGEILGWDLAAERALPFSILGQRLGRKGVDNAMRRAIPVVFMAFDLLYADGELLLPVSLRERRARLEAVVARLDPMVVSPVMKLDVQGGLFDEIGSDPTHDDDKAVVMNGPPGMLNEREKVRRLRLSPVRLVESAEAIDQAYRDARARANEGVMIKAAGSAYLPGRRGLAWVKLKRELATLDVVITGAEFGHGRRAGLLSDYTFAVRGPVGGDGSAELLNVGKAYSGVTDAEIAELTEWLKEHTIEDFGHFRTVEPLRVLEVAFNNIMRSGRHSSGFALRFPRILRVRDDKPVEEIDTVERVEEIYQMQPDKEAEQG